MGNISKIKLQNEVHNIKDPNAYVKPASGIPKTDLAEAVQTSLGKADTAIQDLSPITDLIPSQAASDNQLADKAFVNSSISTATATYKGNYNLVNDLSLSVSATTAQIATALASKISGEDNNDYCFVQIPTADATPTEIARIDRYKYNGTAWSFEYSLNNSGFTSEQWAAINSGITATAVTNTASHIANTDIHVTTANKAAWNAKYDKPSGGIPKTDLADAVQTSLGKADTALQSHQDISGKVDKVSGKGLSTNDYTTAEKNKLSGIETGAQVNVLEGVKVDGTELTITDKKVDIDLSGKVDVADSETNSDEFVYRQTGGGLDIEAKNARVESFKGRSLAWNQLFNVSNNRDANGIIAEYNSTTNLIYVHGTATNNASGPTFTWINNVFPIGHKVLTRYVKKSGTYSSSSAGFRDQYNSSTPIYIPLSGGDSLGTIGDQKYSIPQIVLLTAGDTFDAYYYISQYDLTLLYGSEISGLTDKQILAKFESEFPEAYYPYNAGELISNDAKAVESVGFNQWDEEWETGDISISTGENVSGERVRSKNHIPVMPGQSYYLCSPQNAWTLCLYGKNYEYLSATNWSANTIKEIPADVFFVRFVMSPNYGTTYNHDICINISDPARNGTYEPYKKFTLPLNLDSIKVKSHNIWDEEWEEGYIELNGNKTSFGTTIRSKNYTSCTPGTIYYCYRGSSGHVFIAWYDASKAFILRQTITYNAQTAPSNAYYFKLCTDSDYGNTYLNDICINVSSEFNGKYEPHGILTMTGGLKSAGSVYDEIKDGKYVKRVGEVDMGTLEFGYTSSYNTLFYSNNLRGDIKAAIGNNMINTLYPPANRDPVSTNDNKVVYIHNSSGDISDTWPQLYVRDTSYTDANLDNGHASWLDGVMLYYELATPITYELAEPLRTDYIVDKLGTERVIAESPICPFRADIHYYESNVKDIEIENMPQYLKREELTDELDKLQDIESGAQVNTIEHIKINGTEQTISNKTVNLPAYPTTLPASDVSAWAKAATKPTYTFDEITSKEEKKAAQEFVYRENPATIKAKSLSLDRIYGKTLAWNNRVVNGDFSDGTTGWSVYGATVTVSNNEATVTVGDVPTNAQLFQGKEGITDHIYYQAFSAKASQTGRIKNRMGGSSSSVSVGTTYVRTSRVYKCTSTGANALEINAQNIDLPTGATYTVKDFVSVDLTLLYGSAIDGMTNEQILAKFESEFPGYHDYSAGKLISNDAESMETVGFNQWDEEWELGYFNWTTGEKASTNNRIRSKNYIRVFPSVTYCIKVPDHASQEDAVLLYYDANKQYLGYENVFASSSGYALKQMASNCHFIMFSLLESYGTTYNHDICINLSDQAKNGTYEPYRKSTMQLGLNSIEVNSHNIWDEVWEAGYYDENGNPVASTQQIRSKNLIPVFPSTTYCFAKQGALEIGHRFCFYDSNGNFLSRSEFINTRKFTTGNNVYYIKFHVDYSSVSYNNDICINVSSSFNGQYEPHGDITITGGLKSAGSVYDEIVRNKLYKRIGAVDLGTLNWNAGYGGFCSDGIQFVSVHDSIGACSKYVCLGSFSYSEVSLCVNGTENLLRVYDPSYSDSAAFKSAMSGVMLYYELATPIEYELVSPIYPSVKCGTTEARVSPNADGLSAPMVCDATYSVGYEYIEGEIGNIQSILQTI